MKKIKVLLEPKRKMRDTKGRVWEGMNSKAAKPNKFRRIKTIRVYKGLPRHLIDRTERHEYTEQEFMARHHAGYARAHKRAVKLERKPLKNVKFVEKRIRGK